MKLCGAVASLLAVTGLLLPSRIQLTRHRELSSFALSWRSASKMSQLCVNAAAGKGIPKLTMKVVL